jgi:hypothetical protein
MKTIYVAMISTPIAFLLVGMVGLIGAMLMFYEGTYGLQLLFNPLAW